MYTQHLLNAFVTPTAIEFYRVDSIPREEGADAPKHVGDMMA